MIVQTLAGIMTSPVALESPDTPALAAFQRMRRDKKSSLLIQSEDEPQGMLTERDIVHALNRGRDLSTLRCGELMNTPVVMVPAETDFGEAYHVLAEHGIRHLVVMDVKGAAIGLVTEGDIMRHLGMEHFVRLKEVSRVMTRNVVTLAPNASVADAVALMDEHRISCVVIADERGSPAGVLTERDVVRLCEDSAGWTLRPLGEVMSHPVHTVSPLLPLPDAVQLMESRGIRRLVVVDQSGRIAGLVTHHDMVKGLEGGYVDFLKKLLFQQTEELEQTRQALAESEQQQAETRLRRSEAKYQHILDTAGQGFWMINAAMETVEVNQTLCTMLGYGREEMLGEKPVDFADEENRDIFRQQNACIPTSPHRSYEITLTRKDGSRVPTHFYATTHFDEQGRVAAAFAFVTDLSEQKKTEQELRDKEERIRLLLESSGEGIYGIDTAGCCTFCNPAALQMMGLADSSELLGRNLHHFCHHSYPDGSPYDEDDCPIQRAYKRDEEVLVDGDVFWRRDGSAFAVEYRAYPMRFQGKVVGAVVNFTNITERKRMEESLRKFARAVEQSANAVFITDVHGRIEYVNPKFTAMTGYTLAEAVGKNPRILKSGHTSRDEYTNLWKTVLEGKVWNGEFLNRRKDGSTYWEAASISPILDDSGQITHFVAVKEDIGARKAAEDSLKQLNATLEQRVSEEVARNMAQERMLIHQSRLAAMGEMIGNIAHQWRQPLNALGLLLANVRDAQAYGELTPDYLNQEVEQGERLISKMSSTIDDFRNFFKPNKEKQAFLLARKVRESVEIVSATLRHCGIELTVGGDEDITAVGYPNECSQVLLNLVSNAKDALVERKVNEGRIAIHFERRGGMAVLTVRDNAGGIAPEILPHVFDPYFTTKDKGTGIGLYMSKIIVENNMGGAITARNVDGGAEFMVTCPLAS